MNDQISRHDGAFPSPTKLPKQIQESFQEAKSFEELLTFERQLDSCLQRKKLEIEEMLRSPPKIRRKMRVFVSSQFYPEGFPGTVNGGDETVVVPTGIPSWELRVEGRLIPQEGIIDTKKYKFSSFFKSLVIELDRELYGPDNHLVEWHRTASTMETEGFQVRRPGDQPVKCSILMLLQHQTNQYRLDARLARLLGFPADQQQQNRTSIIRALWSYIKRNKLQDSEEPDFIRPNQYLSGLLECCPGQMVRFVDLPGKVQRLLYPPEPIVINHVIQAMPTTPAASGGQAGSPDPSKKRVQCYHIEVEVDDPLKDQARSFLDTFTNSNCVELDQTQQHIMQTIEKINKHHLRQKFFSEFADNPQTFIDRWLASQCRDLKHLSEPSQWEDLSEKERRAEFYSEQQPWLHEAIGRYIYGRIQLKRQELEKNMDLRRQIGAGKNNL